MKISRLNTGCSPLDNMLGGGFEAGVVSQVYGAGGSGKTNICIQLAVQCVRSGKKVIYIDSEGFSAERFSQIAGSDAQTVANDIIIFEPINFDNQYSCILDTEKTMSEKIGLIILDSATVYYRLDLEGDDNMKLRRTLANQIGLLHGIARKYNIPVLITNQIYTDINTGNAVPLGGNMMEHISKAIIELQKISPNRRSAICLLYTSDAADEEDSVDLGGRRIIKKKKKKKKTE